MVKFKDCYMCIDAINPKYQSIVNRCYKKSRQYCLAVNDCHEQYYADDTLKMEKLWNSLELLRETLPKREIDNFNAQYSKIHGYTI